MIFVKLADKNRYDEFHPCLAVLRRGAIADVTDSDGKVNPEIRPIV